MTRNQAKVLDIIFREFCASGITPSYRTIARAIGLKSLSGVSRMVHALIRQGYLKQAGGSRSVEPTGKATDLYGLMTAWGAR